ncbi:hypothetical protein [Neobacillus sp. 19]|uniref:hypothetical protein n=1 Tax=Neobacillus sp. 19 TaxID=3394458 RepID=UPI003C2D1200
MLIISRVWMTDHYTAKYTVFTTLYDLEINDKIKTNVKRTIRQVKKTERNDLKSIIYN